MKYVEKNINKVNNGEIVIGGGSMFKWILFGRLIQKSMDSFSRGEYPLAVQLTDQAIKISSEDFLANFLRLRLAIIQKQTDIAEHYLAQCKLIDEKAASVLVTDWENALIYIKEGGEISAARLEQIEASTRVELDNLRNDKGLTLLEPVIAFGMLVFIGYILNMFFPREMLYKILDITCALLLLVYYNLRFRLKINLYLRIYQLITNLRIFLSSPFVVLAMVALIIVKLFVPHVKTVHPSHNVLDFVVLFSNPVGWRLLDCGIIFGSVRKYGRAWAYVISSVWVVLTDGVGAALASLIYFHSFEEYRTIAAPIFLSFIAMLISYW